MNKSEFNKDAVKALKVFVYFCVHLIIVTGLPLPVTAQQAPENTRQSAQSPEQAGWKSDVYGARHFSGMRCPDIVGFMYRIKLLPGQKDRTAGCTYTGKNGLMLIVRQHTQGTGATAATTFLEAYKNAGFRQVSLTGAAATGISFITAQVKSGSQCETLWYLTGRQADYSIWIAYKLPIQEDLIAPTLSTFKSMLALQNQAY